MMLTDIAIRTNGLTKRFGDFTAVDHISFDVRKGEIFGFLGPNGAGKSTTIRMLCTLSRPSEGTATVAGFDIIKEDGRVRENIGLVSEKLIMYNDLTARENLKLFGKLYDIPKVTLDKRIDELLRFVRMEKWADARIGTFSTGMKQRINVIRALVNEPSILFLDEPTLGLDPQSSVEIRDLIKKISVENQTTMILTTHMMVEADLLCSRIGIIDKGKIVALDTSGGLKRIVSGTDASIFEFDISNLSPALMNGLRSLGCVSSVLQEDETRIKLRAAGDDSLDQMLDVIRMEGGKIRSVKNLEPSLEDVFIHITGREVREQVTDRVPMGPRHGPGRHRVASSGRVR
jgi:ABC-2 type transport system ATP-binding protein